MRSVVQRRHRTQMYVMVQPVMYAVTRQVHNGRDFAYVWMAACVQMNFASKKSLTQLRQTHAVA